MAWKQGPLPPGTYQWGGVVLVGEKMGGGFYFADFCGDHVKIQGNDGTFSRVVVPADVALYDNSLELPPNMAGRAE